MIRLRLTRKLAAVLNGVDVSSLRVGDIVELPDTVAHMLIAEGWAEVAQPSPVSAAGQAGTPPSNQPQ